METIQNFNYLFAAFAILWVVIFGYFFFLTRQLGELRRDVNALREERAGGESGPDASPDS